MCIDKFIWMQAPLQSIPVGGGLEIANTDRSSAPVRNNHQHLRLGAIPSELG